MFHVHPPYATAFAAGKKIPMLTEAAKIVLFDIPLLQPGPPGSIELARKVAEGFRDPRVKAVLLRAHGIVSIGENLENAFHAASSVEDTAKVAFLSGLLKN